MLRPATVAEPDVGGSSVVSIRSVVDLPAPFGPRKATSSPAATSMSIPLTASTVFPFFAVNVRANFSVWIIRSPFPYTVLSRVQITIRCTKKGGP